MIQLRKNSASHQSTESNAKKLAEQVPYLDGRREWNERFGPHIAQAKKWRMIALLCLLACLLESTALVVLATQHKIVPFVVQVNKLGMPTPVTRADEMQPLDERVLRALLARFISDTRSVVADTSAQRQMIDRVYSMLDHGTKAFNAVNEFYRNDPPFERAEKIGVYVEVHSVSQLTERTWQVNWDEMTRSNTGELIGTVQWKATLTLVHRPPTDEVEIRQNPLGIYIVDFNWAQTL